MEWLWGKEKVCRSMSVRSNNIAHYGVTKRARIHDMLPLSWASTANLDKIQPFTCSTARLELKRNRLTE